MYDIAQLDVPPLRRVAGTVRLPGSKSISNRVLLLAGLAEGRTEIHDLLDSDDTRVMLQALRRLGCGIATDGGLTTVTGIGGSLRHLRAPLALHLGNAGTAMRPLAAALALLATRDGGEIELSGVARMHERPIGDLVDALRQLGAQIDYLDHDGFPPLRIRAGGALHTERPIRVRGDVSSQFLSALLLALPLVSGGGGPITVEVDGELISRPYVELTLALLQRFGITVQHQDLQRFVIPAGSRYRAPARIHVEGDASSASYFIAAGAIAAVEAPLRIEGVGLDSIQGDIRFIDAARAMGAQVTGGASWIEVRRGAWPLAATTLDCNHMPDAAMTLAAMALYAEGRTRLTRIGSWRVKETDRIAAMAAELRKLGASVVDGADFIEVEPPASPGAWRRATLHTYDDHRMAMCLSLAAFNPLLGARVAVRLLDPRCVGKTFPEYFETLFGVAQTDAADIPVIAVDGPTASGKGTLAAEVAARLGWHQLDSGALYRATALAAMRAGVASSDVDALERLAAGLALRFDGDRAYLDGVDVSAALRHEAVGALASHVSALPAVRQALHARQLSFRRVPGLVADGRDMGTVVFPDATLKVFLTASAAMRAERRHKQLMAKGISAKLDALRADLEARDVRDMQRAVSPLKPAQDALLLDNSSLTVEQSADRVLQWWNERSAFD